jgi:hypothetical protein
MVKARSERKMMAKIKSRFPIFAHLRCSKVRPPTEVSGCKTNLLKQANKELRVARSKKPNPQLTTLNSQPK